jgi:predicted Zn-dependent protease
LPEHRSLGTTGRVTQVGLRLSSRRGDRRSEVGIGPGGGGEPGLFHRNQRIDMRISSSRALFAALCFTTLAAQPGCARNPVTGQMQLALITEGQEIQMGQEGAADVRRSLGLVPDAALQQYVRDIGLRIAAISERPDLPWSFEVVDDPTPNAFALPGGPIFVTRGMMNLMSTEAQLATVLGHEVAHVTARHHVTRLSRAQIAQLGLGVGGVLFPGLEAVGQAAGVGLQLVFLQHGREAERQADDLGFRYALEQGWDVREMTAVFSSLQRLGDTQQRSAIPGWLQTHPAPADRIQSVQARLEAMQLAGTTLRIGRQDYLNRIDGLPYGVNPRNGFFRDGRYFHPDLRFQIVFPRGWQTQNMAQAVVAVSPQQNAAMQLSLAQDATPEAAAQRFLQGGVQAGPTSRTTINGLPAVVASFRAQTQQGTLQGTVGFVSYDGRVYQIMGYSALAAFPANDPLFTQTIRSFASLADPQILNIQPNLISVVRTDRAMTLAEFNQRFPSAIPIAELAILNELPGENSPIPGGSLVKRVVQGTP